MPYHYHPLSAALAGGAVGHGDEETGDQEVRHNRGGALNTRRKEFLKEDHLG